MIPLPPMVELVGQDPGVSHHRRRPLLIGVPIRASHNLWGGPIGLMGCTGVGEGVAYRMLCGVVGGLRRSRSPPATFTPRPNSPTAADPNWVSWEDWGGCGVWGGSEEVGRLNEAVGRDGGREGLTGYAGLV